MKRGQTKVMKGGKQGREEGGRKTVVREERVRKDKGGERIYILQFSQIWGREVLMFDFR